ncbi:hypothetical protein Y032_0103g3545 [Ancylostoma ceylanicum]|uniref:Fibronectin type-III domain-containing protein n=3 Tax=Ancylostoma ceylanicum TaxID=53326 RepID=A0A016TG22_9BILA|nr:hypothetical protein Y032_0103g3545 [Ancylostoma ceylanicum]
MLEPSPRTLYEAKRVWPVRNFLEELIAKEPVHVIILAKVSAGFGMITYQGKMRRLYLLVTLLRATLAVTLLPYIQIDYAHYFRLAQCQAKCTQKYGVPTTRHLLDGSIQEHLDVRNSACKDCETGCGHHRRLHGRGPRGPAKSPMDDGLRFWAESSADTAKTGSTLVSSVELLCQNPSLDEEFGESSEGLLSILLLRPSGATRFIIQWKHRIQGLVAYEETQWITASVEPDTLFKVNGLVPGVQYRFMVTAVGPAGRLGETVASPWTEITTGPAPRAPVGALTLRNGYNSDRGVTVHVEWPQTAQDSCYFRIQLSNSSVQINKDVVLDSSSSILLPHLEFETDYSVTVAATSADKAQTSKPLTANFKSLLCKDVHGQGSLQCAPEPVSNLAIVLRPNGTGIISWKPSADPENILFYQLIYHALSNENGCQQQQETINVRAAATSAIVDFPGERCEYVVRLVNYDLIGRDAVAEARVLIELSKSFLRLDTLLRPEFLLTATVVLLLFLLCILVRCRCGRRCPHRVCEKQEKLTDYA